MPNLLFVSANDFLLRDFADQLAHYAADFTLLPDDDLATPDLIVIDEDCARLEQLHRQNLKAPIFLLTSHADDIESPAAYIRIVPKPFTLDELINELHSSINLFENSKDGYLSFNRYVVRPVKKDICNQRNNEVVKLTEKEVAVIKYLYKNRDRIVTKNELLQEVWGYALDATTHTIETHVYRLRQKVEHDDAEAQLIITLDGGYQLKV